MKYLDKQGIALFGGLILGGAGLAMESAAGVIIAVVGVGLAMALEDSATKESKAEWERKRLEALQDERKPW